MNFQVLPTLPGYLTDAGKLELDRIEIFMKSLAELEEAIMLEKEEEVNVANNTGLSILTLSLLAGGRVHGRRAAS